MNTISLNTLCYDISQQLDSPTLLFGDHDHRVYWLGIPEITAFRCNAYLVVDGQDVILIDPGNRNFFAFVKDRVAQILPPESVTGILVCHQDPDVGSSFVDWLQINPKADVITSFRTHVLLPHYGAEFYRFVNIEEDAYQFASGRRLEFIPSPFLHSPGAFATYDATSQFLFSGDVWAALDMNWRLVLDNFAEHVEKLDLFHVDYMASNIAARGFAERLDAYKIAAILPQHGSIIPEAFVAEALDYLRNLRCGLDLIYSTRSGRS